MNHPHSRRAGPWIGLLCVVLAAVPATAQESWNDPAVLSLVERARALRTSAAVDSTFESYRAEARGRVYFFVDRPDSSEYVLVKGDQVALDVYWRAPNTTKQWIVGRRDEKVLPTNIRYHLDHLTVVQDDFGDFIRLGDGDEVEAVVHPVGPRGEDVYDFALSDSLTLSYAGGAEQIRVYEISVRPRDLDAPGFVGTLYLDRDRAAIVRMNFSFTPSSYVDPYLDHIRISLDNSLWMGRHWLPYRQQIEIRRETPVLDFQAGSTIRTEFDIRGYDFNVEIPDRLMTGQRVRAVSPSEQEAFLFEEGIFDQLEAEGGLGASPTMEEVEAQVREVVGREVMSGLAPIRLHLSRLSDFARYNRAEGLYLGGGLTFRPLADVEVRTTGGYALGRRRGAGAMTVVASEHASRPTLDAYWDAVGDIGGHPGASPLENTITSVSGSKDYLDPYFRRGATLSIGLGEIRIAGRVEEQSSAVDVVSDGPDTEFRPVRSIHEGTLLSVTADATLRLPVSGTLRLTATGGSVADREFASLVADAGWVVDGPDADWTGEFRATFGVTNADAPAQTFFLIGGRHTLPGYDYRSFVGNRYLLLHAEGTIPVFAPWIGLRVFSTAGMTWLGDVDLPADWILMDTDGLRATAGLGLSIGWDTMRLDVGRALQGGGWEAVFSVAPRFRNWL